MAVPRQLSHSTVRDLLEVEPPPPERLELEASPRADTVASYVLTRAAERSWDALNRHLTEPTGAFFWVRGDAGVGKTHFLNYVLALAARAGSLSAEPGRQLTCALEVAGVVRQYEIEAYLLDALAEQFGAEPRAALVWRQLSGAPALRVALDAARRIGLRAITVVIDFGLSDYQSASGYFRILADIATNSKPVRFTVIAAGRGPAPADAQALDVAPADVIETAVIGIRRARRIGDGPSSRAAIDALYHGLDTHDLSVDAIFPFHPFAVPLLAMLTAPAPAVAAAARIAREAIIAARKSNGLGRTIYPVDLMAVPAIGRQTEARLGAVGVEALAICRDIVRNLRGNERELAREIVDTLALERAAGGSALAFTELEARVPILAETGSDAAWTRPLLTDLLRRLSTASRGAIVLVGDQVCFEPEASGAPEVALYNAALALARHFDPTLTPARAVPELQSRLDRLQNALAGAVESASRTRQALREALADAHLELPAEHTRTIADYLEFAEGGVQALLKAGNDATSQPAILGVIAAYEKLAGAAEVVPRMRMMREYLDGTALKVSYQLEPGKDPHIAALETECQLLRVELEPRVLLGSLKMLDALEARFQKFKWTYVQNYLGAHEQWRLEMNRLALLAGDVRRYVDALNRLNAITALGPPEGADLASRLDEAASCVVRCELSGPLQPEVAPLCPSCGYVLGTQSPRAELSDLLDQLKLALSIKLTALSQSAIARIIREHDQEHRLEGFLKITQAAQTDALTRVLDERLARYLAQLLDENLGAALLKPRAAIRGFDREVLKTPRLRSAPKPGANR
jgi:hypothetical protein